MPLELVRVWMPELFELKLRAAPRPLEFRVTARMAEGVGGDKVMTVPEVLSGEVVLLLLLSSDVDEED
jgi:hypothetical protein